MKQWIKNIPFPPSANDLYRPVTRGRFAAVIKTTQYKAYSDLISFIKFEKIESDHPMALYVYFFAPKEYWLTKQGKPQRKDLDNRLKSLDPIFKTLNIDDKMFFEIHAYKCISSKQRVDLLFTDELATHCEVF